MGMSTHVCAFKPPDAKWKKMKKVWDACKGAGIDVPDNVSEYFNHETPDESGAEISEETLEKCGALERYSEGSSGYDIVIDKLPKGVKIVRVYNSW